jgi:hypothetical protein
LVSTLFAGCTSAPIESIEKATEAQKFNPPSEVNVGYG